jgi:FtsP/CotA-like multicopper oxidase with cupredoxin domain
MTAGVNTSDPYAVPPAIEDDPNFPIAETTITAALTKVEIGGGRKANAETYNGTIPGPTFPVIVNDSLFVRLINNLPHATAIHWHGVEMANHKDGSPFTQKSVPPGGTYLYKLRFPRPGLYWYHPHHDGSTNQVFRGLYGVIIVSEDESLLIQNNIPDASQALPLVLSDITVCKPLGQNDQFNYPNPNNDLPWVGNPNGTVPVQTGPTPYTLCEFSPLDDDGSTPGPQFNPEDIPNIQPMTVTINQVPWNEGQTVLTNGVNVGGRGGSPNAPAATLDAGASTWPVMAGQGVRLQIFNAATMRYFRLILMNHDGTAQIPLFRIGGEGGLLDHPVLEGVTSPSSGTFDPKYTQGEILLPPGSRADVVAVIPASAVPNQDVLTMWTQDFKRTGPGYAKLPSVPVMHLKVVSGSATSPTISTNTLLRSIAVKDLGLLQTGNLLDPLTFAPSPFSKFGLSSQTIVLNASGGMVNIDNEMGSHQVSSPYSSTPHVKSARYAKSGDVLQLKVKNNTGAHHPFHKHGFSMQPISLTQHATDPDYIWPYHEFRDNIDIPAGYTLTFRIELAPRNLVDDVTPGGEMGRWMFHCHIFFHAEMGMMSELVVVDVDGSEKPNVDVDGSWAYAQSNGIATRTGTYAQVDGHLPLNSLTASLGTITDNGNGTWSWLYNGPNVTTYVYVTATDSQNRKDQTVFRLKVGGLDDGADNGDPHIKTVDGKYYDFQSAGEFTLLRDLETGLEIQVRQTPVRAANPVTDLYSGIRACVSVNTAVAAQLGRHCIAYQQGRDGKRMQLFLDGKPIEVPERGLNLGEHRVTAEAVSGGGTAIRVDFADQTVLIITPLFWTSYGVWYLNVSVAHTQADRGLMGRILSNSWLPALQNGGTVGPKPANLHDRWVALYRTFADAWRVTNKSSLFVYAPGTSTKDFTDRNWPAEEAPCNLLPQFEFPGEAPVLKGVEIGRAEELCRRVTIDGLHQNCVFDVATTGDKVFATGYELVQKLRRRATAVQVVADRPKSRPGESIVITAIVTNLFPEGEKPSRGTVTFFVDDKEAGPAVKFDERCTAKTVLNDLKAGEHRVRAEYSGTRSGPQASSSPNLILTVGREIRKVEPVHNMPM